MHKKLFLLFFSIMIFGTLAHAASALSLNSAASSVSGVIYRPFGGRVTTITKVGVTCTRGKGPITIVPANKSSFSVDYLDVPGTNKTQNQPTPNAWMLGLHNSITDTSSCYTGQYPYRISYPVNAITLYGASGFR